MYFHEWVNATVFPFNRVSSLRCALCEERKARYIVAKYDRAVILWVNTAFHNRTSVSDTGRLVKGYCWGGRGSSSGAFTEASAVLAKCSDGR